MISHECVTHAPHYRGQTNYRPGFTPLHIFGRAALCSSDVNTALLKLSPLPSCIPAAFGNTLKPLSHYFPANSSGYLFICNRISRNGGGNTAAAGRSLCTTDIVSQNPCRSGHRATATTQLRRLLALRLPSVRTMKTYCDISQSLNSALETVPICQSNYRQNTAAPC